MMIEEINRLVNERTSARRTKDFRRADDIRTVLLKHGVEVIDLPDGGSQWIKYRRKYV